MIGRLKSALLACSPILSARLNMSHRRERMQNFVAPKRQTFAAVVDEGSNILCGVYDDFQISRDG
jgi:hypothetical protein